MNVSLDGFIEGPNGELDWAMEGDEWWDDEREFFDSVDACILGRIMYPDYERYWMAVLDNPSGPLPISGKPASRSDVEYARWADQTPHYVLSGTLDEVSWQTTRIIRDVDEIRKIKSKAGRDIVAVGGATLVSSLMNEGLVDVLRLTVNPVLLGSGKRLFKDLAGRQGVDLIDARPLHHGRVALVYDVQNA